MNEQIQWQSILIGFLSGFVLSAVGIIITYFLQRRSDRQKQLEQIQFEIYMKLMELHGLYFWVCAAEANHEGATPDIKNKIWKLAWQISDKLRVADELKCTPQILDVLFSNHYATAKSRNEVIEKVIDELSKTINPRFAEAMRDIGTQNINRMIENPTRPTNTPGFI